MQLGLRLRQARAQQAYAAVDVRADGRRNHEVWRRGHHRPHGRNAAGVKVRRGTGFADCAMALRVGNRGKVQQLADGLVLQRQTVGQQNSGCCLLVMDLIDMVSVGDLDALT